MKYSLAAGLLLTGSACAVLELPVAKRDKHTDGKTRDVARGLFPRANPGTLETTLFSGVGYVSGGSYYLNISVGTPPQDQTVLLDTGSSDLYLDASSAPACTSNGPHRCEASTFDSSSSSTYQQIAPSPAFNASYGDGSYAIGPYGSDVVCINDLCIDNVQFGLATQVNSTVGPAIGLMGVGATDIEATRSLYPNIPQVLVDAGIINSRLYSLYLNDYDAITGSILFGGIDTDKYTGTLTTIDTLPDPVTGYVDQFITAITALSTNVGGQKTSIFSGGAAGAAAFKSATSLPVLLDSGSSAWSVPNQVYKAVVNEFSYIDANTGVAPCSYAYSGDSVTITINGQIDINVDISNFFLPIYEPGTSTPVTYNDGEQACNFEIIPSGGTGEGFDTMGDAMIRAMYVVYDLDQGQMSIAQANLNSTSTNVKEVPAGPGGVAKAIGANSNSVPTQSYSVAPGATSTTFSVSTAKSTLGTATGLSAVPTAARVSGEAAGSGSGSSSGSSPSSSHHHSGAEALKLSQTGWSGMGAVAAVALGTVLGAALML